MFYFKSCPKCQGDMYVDRDAYGAFRKCLQCGHMIEIELQQLGYAKPASQKLAA